MNYPVWELYYAGGGFLIAFIAIVHVYVSHFAVGGGFFLVLTEMKGIKEKSPLILEYIRKHAKFFMLVTMVFSAVTGVGIWFTISLLSPGATSILTHTFVFAFAAEWIFFVVEIVAIFLYFYTFNKINDKAHIIIGWIYAIAALISLILINGIIAFMLTPGEWLETGNFWDGFLNPSFLSSMFFRTFIAFVFAGIFGFLTAVFIKEKDFREYMIRYCARWLLIPFVFMVLSAAWYFSDLPEPIQKMISDKSPELVFFVKVFMIILSVLFFSGLLMAIRLPHKVKTYMAFFILGAGLIYMGSFEMIREAGRRPYLIYNYMYSNSIKTIDVTNINRQGLLKTSKWAKNKDIDDENIYKAGKEIFKLQCICCHSVGGPLNDILPISKKFSLAGMDAELTGQGKINDYMPKFVGTKSERLALAKYIVNVLNGDKAVPCIKNKSFKKVEKIKVPGFDEKKDKYILLAWSNTNTHGIITNSKSWEKPVSCDIISSQLIKRGEIPEIITEKVEIVYELESEVSDLFALYNIKAREKGTGQILGKTKLIIPVDVKMGCGNCHGHNDHALNADFFDILKTHDRINKTKLIKEVKQNRSVSCESCHGDLLNVSAAVHGFHANYMTGMGDKACKLCHSAMANDDKDNAQTFCGIHKELGFECINCHGNMEDHALSLLKAEKAAGKPGIGKLMRHLFPISVDSVKDIKPRVPWINEPDCLNCHVDFNEPETDETFNLWTKSSSDLYQSRSDDAGVMCQACHGRAHAIYPVKNSINKFMGNIQPAQYQGNFYPMGSNKNCKLCHTIDMEEEMHHPNTLTMFRNVIE